MVAKELTWSGIHTKFASWRQGQRVKTPTVLQMEAVECGAACLAIVMGYYGRIAPLEELRVACGVSRDGSKANNILVAARKFGFKAQGFKREIEKLRPGPFPMIIFWNFSHFVVLEGFGRDKVFINCPGRGPITVPMDEFDESFTGIVLDIRPTPSFKPGGRRPSLLQALSRRLEGSRLALTHIVLASLCLTLLGIVIPSFTRIFVDHFIVQGLSDWIVPLLVVMGLTAVLVAAFTWLQQRYLLRLETKLSLSMSAQFFWHVLHLPIDFFNQRRAADISVRVNINDRIAQLLSGEVATNLIRIVLVVFYATVMVQYDLWLTAIGIALALVNIFALRYISYRRMDASHKLMNEQGKFYATAFNGLQMIETFKSTGREGDFFARWAGQQAKTLNAEQELGVYTELLAALPSTLMAITIALVVMLGGLRVIAGGLSVGALVAFQGLILSFLVPINGLVSLGDRLQLTSADMIRIDDVMRYPAEPMTARQTQTAAVPDVNAKLLGYLELRGITFGYSRLDPPLIENFNLALKPGSRVALVGGSGSGKSTLAKLVTGVYEPWAGEILFDGQQRTEIPRTRFKNSVAMVDQDIYLLEGAIRDNITMWDDTVPEADIILAAKDSAIHSEIAARPGGYYDRVSEGGTNFSGGQRQRLEIARALVTNPSLLVVDEATSALDPITEKAIDDNLRRRGCTCLIIAHRLSTIRDCDEIIVMERGKVVERGTHDRLIRANGPYARLIKADVTTQAKTQSVFDLLAQS